jgi:hypothetical protein
MTPFLAWLESTAVSVWIRESPSLLAFPGILACHTIGMGFAAGINAAVALRILGVAATVPLAEMRRFLPVMWFGFWLNAASGVALLIAYPTKALTNPLFYVKLALVASGVWLVKAIDRHVRGGVSTGDSAPPRITRALAAASLGSWAGAIAAGRLLAYTYSHLMAGH